MDLKQEPGESCQSSISAIKRESSIELEYLKCLRNRWHRKIKSSGCSGHKSGGNFEHLADHQVTPKPADSITVY